MKKPLDTLEVTQPFGANPKEYKQFGFLGHEGTDFRTKNLKPATSWWNDLMGWRPIYAVRDGTCVAHYGAKNYGNHIYLTGLDGNQYLYAHLKNARPPRGSKTVVNTLVFDVREGDIIGLSNNTGHSTGPHLHFGYRPKGFNVNNGYGGFVDPMILFDPIIANPTLSLPVQIAFIGPKNDLSEAFKDRVGNYSNGKICFTTRLYIASFTGGLSQDHAYDFVDQINPKEKFVFLHTPGAAFYSTYYYPKRGCMITQCPGNNPRLLAFEFAHQLGTMVNATLGWKFQVEDSMGPTDDMIYRKYQLAIPFYK